MEDAVQVHTSKHLRFVDIFHLLKLHVRDSEISEYHSAVEDADDGWEGLDDGLMNGPESLFVGHVADWLI